MLQFTRFKNGTIAVHIPTSMMIDGKQLSVSPLTEHDNAIISNVIKHYSKLLPLNQKTDIDHFSTLVHDYFVDHEFNGKVHIMEQLQNIELCCQSL